MATVRVLIDVLSDYFDGVIGCNYFSAYSKYMNDCDIQIQFCLAHLIREWKYLAGLPDKATVDYGQRLLDAMREMFHIFHKVEELAAGNFTNAMEESRNAFLNIALSDVPDSRPAQNLANRFRQYGQAYFRFITTPGIEPTNNLAEQAIRFVVVDRHITQGTRSEYGHAWCERIWTVLATCASQGRNAFDFIYMPVYSSSFLRSNSAITTGAIVAIFARPHPVNGYHFFHHERFYFDSKPQCPAGTVNLIQCSSFPENTTFSALCLEVPC